MVKEQRKSIFILNSGPGKNTMENQRAETQEIIKVRGYSLVNENFQKGARDTKWMKAGLPMDEERGPALLSSAVFP